MSIKKILIISVVVLSGAVVFLLTKLKTTPKDTPKVSQESMSFLPVDCEPTFAEDLKYQNLKFTFPKLAKKILLTI